MARHRRQEWDGEPADKFEPADIWIYDPPVTPPVDLEARAAGRRRSAQIRADVDRYLVAMGCR